MDTWNNSVGSSIGASLPINSSAEDIAAAVMAALNRGELITQVPDPYGRTAELSEFLKGALVAVEQGRDAYIAYQQSSYHSLDTWGDKADFIRDAFFKAGAAAIYRDPLVLDLTGDGVTLLSLSAGTNFDMDATGMTHLLMYVVMGSTSSLRLRALILLT